MAIATGEGVLLVTGVVGNTGRSFVHQALAQQSTATTWSRIVATIPSSCATLIAELEREFPRRDQVEFVLCDFTADLNKARRGKNQYFTPPVTMGDLIRDGFGGMPVRFIYVVPSSSVERVHHVEEIVQAAETAGTVQLIVMVSSVVASSSSDSHSWASQYRHMESILSDAAVPYVILRCSVFMEALFGVAETVRTTGKLRLPVGCASFAPVSIDDVSRTACWLFANRSYTRSAVFTLAGPECVDGDVMAERLSEAVGAQIVYEPIVREVAVDMLRSQGLDKWLADGVVQLFESAHSGDMKFTGTLADAVSDQELGGERTSLTKFFRHYADYFAPAQLSPAKSPTIPRSPAVSHPSPIQAAKVQQAPQQRSLPTPAQSPDMTDNLARLLHLLTLCETTLKNCNAEAHDLLGTLSASRQSFAAPPPLQNPRARYYTRSR